MPLDWYVGGVARGLELGGVIEGLDGAIVGGLNDGGGGGGSLAWYKGDGGGGLDGVVGEGSSPSHSFLCGSHPLLPGSPFSWGFGPRPGLGQWGFFTGPTPLGLCTLLLSCPADEPLS